jgi:hypothetical protein
MRIKIQTQARDLHDAIDAAWQRERHEARCPECDGTELSEDTGICWGCSARDYLEDGVPTTELGP